MKTVYPVLFTKKGDKRDTYLIEIPDINGMTEGYGIENAIEMARDCIGCMCYDKETIPEATPLENIDPENGEFAEAGETFVSLVDIDLGKYKRMMDKRAVRKNVSIPAWLSEEAEKAHVNVSRILQKALIEELGLEA